MAKSNISWNSSREENALIERIATRAKNMKLFRAGTDKLDCIMDISACHLNGCPLRLEELLAAPDTDFGHDIGGIQRFISRANGKLYGTFVPRYAKGEQA